MQYQKRNYIKTYDENGVLVSKVPVVAQPVVEEETPAEEEDV